MPSEKKQILVVEDEVVIGADIQNQLEGLGYSVPVVAASGPEAIRAARQQPCDLVLMDIRLRGEMDGIETAEILKSELDIPVIYVTAYADWETVQRAKLTGPHGYIMKPLREAEVRSAVEIALHRHELETNLRINEAWLSNILRNIGEAVMVTDANGEVELLNPVAEDLTGWLAEDAHGRPACEVLPLLDEATGQQAAHPVLRLLARERGAEREGQSYLLAARDRAHMPVEVRCFENRAGNYLLGTIVVFRDLIARRAMEQRLRQADTMAAIGRLSRGLAHDFNNQLTVMLGYARVLCENLTGRSLKDAEGVRKAAEVAASMTRQLVSMSREEAAHPEPLDLNDLVREMQGMIAHTLGKGHELVLDLAPQLGRIRADRDQLKRVLVNLTFNACDAMPRGGVMKIETVKIVVPESDGTGTQPAGRYVQLRLSDSGDGMNEKTLAHIFEPFFTTKSRGTGTGLGLAVVHGIITQHRGCITVASEENQGTTFTILLPVLA